MDEANLKLATGLVSKGYIEQGAQSLRTRQKRVKSLLSQRRLPPEGWDDATIETLLYDLAAMDSNNAPGNIGMGEREGRVIAPLVTRRHYGMAHGIGRSGDVTAEQPKAAGSSLMAKLTALLAADALELAGLKDLAPVVILPLATGMALTMTLMALRPNRPPEAKYVIWPRLDQKTCLKSIVSANLVPAIIENRLDGDLLFTDLEAVEGKLEELGAAHVVSVVSSSSCFAPRGCDALIEIAKLCERHGVPHIINNAYGVQSAYLCQYGQIPDGFLEGQSALCREVTAALRRGRVDAIVQSTDKNFMVPVGGSLVAAPAKRPELLSSLKAAYPGRASGSPHLDLFITLLHLGAHGWTQVLKEREALFERMKEQFASLGAELGEKCIVHPRNPISLAMTLDHLSPESDSRAVTFLGAQLFTKQSPPLPGLQTRASLFRCVSGTRVVAKGKRQEVSGIAFEGYGAHQNAYPHHYLTAAVALGCKKEDLDGFIEKLKAVYVQSVTPSKPDC